MMVTNSTSSSSSSGRRINSILSKNNEKPVETKANFQQFANNDKFGHVVGDQVLRGVASAVKSQVRATDYVFRWGGEEFLIVCTDTNSDDLAVLAEKLRRTLATMDWRDIPGLSTVTCSFGVSAFPKHAQDVESLFIAADSALYRAKTYGRNRVEQALEVLGRTPDSSCAAK